VCKRLGMSSRTTITEPGHESVDAGGDGLAVLVMSVEAFASFPLPPVASVVIGRLDECEVQIEDPLASRRHARLHLTPSLCIEDLGSANGTRLGSALIPSGKLVPLAVGETVGIGSSVLVVQGDRGVAKNSRRVWSHRWFETRLIDECEQCNRSSGGRFALVRLRLERPAPWARVVPLIDRNVPPPHVFAAYGPHDYELLVLDAGAEEAAAVVETIRNSLASLETPVRVGIACHPRDGRTADSLMGVANAQLRPGEQAPEVSLAGAGVSPAMHPVLDLARRTARSNINVLILGETGVGKEVMAQALHEMSTRAGQKMLALNCAGLPETLIESELFGHEKGAFTGAVSAKKGLFEAASGGTLFLDEIGEMPLTMQARLLRAIANREILPVGATKPRAIDVRILAATNRNLEAEVKSGAFRGDLYYRLNGMSLLIPPLRERRSEIPGLANLFMAEAARAAGRPQTCTITAGALALLLEYDWPGNIRELRNLIERAMVLCEGDFIDVAHLPADRMHVAGTPALRPQGARTVMALGRVLSPAEEEDRRRILDALEAYTWNQSRAAKALGMHRRTFISKLDRYGIPRPQKGRASPAEAADTDEDPPDPQGA
jgi:two-component system, NtrC family, response regulator AtoC